VGGIASDAGDTFVATGNTIGTSVWGGGEAIIRLPANLALTNGTANYWAPTNWLALGQYFTIKRQYPQARATYRRVIDTYTNPTDRPYREQALRALKDLDMLNPSTTTTTTNP